MKKTMTIEQLNKRYQQSKLAAYAVIALALVMITMLIWPYNIITWEDEYFPVLNKKVIAGDPVVYEVAYCKNSDLSAKLSKSLVNDNIYLYSAVDSNAECGCHVVNATLETPSYAEPGLYHVKIVYEYSPNLLRKITYTKESEVFEIVKNEDR